MKRFGVVSVLAVMLAGPGPALAEAAVVSGQSNGIPYATGGVGLEAREALRAKEKDFNLMVVLSLKDGHYLGGGKVAVRNVRGKSVLEVEAQGPWVLAKLAPGKYVVQATLGGTTRSKHVTVAKAGIKRVHLTWDHDPS